ncbi:MAG: hypothetical protein IKW45_05100 [Clostridia bacterium]|nr:hypothetical protein [Clostridia bacterium]
MIKRIEDIYKDVTGREDVVFTEETEIDKDFDSFSFIQFVCCVEDEFDIDVPNSAIKGIKTVGDAMKLIEKLMNE